MQGAPFETLQQDNWSFNLVTHQLYPNAEKTWPSNSRNRPDKKRKRNLEHCLFSHKHLSTLSLGIPRISCENRRPIPALCRPVTSMLFQCLEPARLKRPDYLRLWHLEAAYKASLLTWRAPLLNLRALGTWLFDNHVLNYHQHVLSRLVSHFLVFRV